MSWLKKERKNEVVPPGAITSKMHEADRNLIIDELTAEILTQDLEQIRNLFGLMDAHLGQLSALVQNQPVIDEHICKLGNSVEGLKTVISRLNTNIETRLLAVENELKAGGVKQDHIINLLEALLENQHLSIPKQPSPEEKPNENIFSAPETEEIRGENTLVESASISAGTTEQTGTQKILEKLSTNFPLLAELDLQVIERNSENYIGWQAGMFWIVALPPAKENGDYDHNQFHKGVFPELQNLRRNTDAVVIVYDGNINKRAGVEKEAADRKFILTTPEDMFEKIKERIRSPKPAGEQDDMKIVRI